MRCQRRRTRGGRGCRGFECLEKNRMSFGANKRELNGPGFISGSGVSSFFVLRRMFRSFGRD